LEPSNAESTNVDGYPIDGIIRKNKNDEDFRHNGTMSIPVKTTMDIVNIHRPTIAETLIVRLIPTSHFAKRRRILRTEDFHGNTLNIMNMEH